MKYPKEIATSTGRIFDIVRFEVTRVLHAMLSTVVYINLIEREQDSMISLQINFLHSYCSLHQLGEEPDFIPVSYAEATRYLEGETAEWIEAEQYGELAHILNLRE